MKGATLANGATLADLALIVPELILVVVSLALLLAARRIAATPLAAVVTVLAALGAMAASDPGSREVSSAFGGMLGLDGYSQFFKFLIAATLAMTALLSVKSVSGGRVSRPEYHVLLLLAATGMMFAASALDLLILYLGLELVTLCSYILVGITVERPTANEGAIKYFLLGSFASALFLYGISLTYGVVGSTNFGEIAGALASDAGQPLLLGGMVLVTAGLAFKIAAVPFHSWAPDAYQGASAPVAAFLAAGAKAAGLAALGRVCLVAFGNGDDVLLPILVVLSALSMVGGSLLAITQTNMKRLLAYSSIAHAGYALLGLVAGTAAGVSSTMTYAFFYVFMTLGAFGVVVALGARGETLDDYRGLAAQRPGAALLLLLFLLSLTGIPLTAGFAAKFVVILSAVHSGHLYLAVLAVICSVVSAFIYMRVAVFMYMKEPRGEAPARFPAAIGIALAVAAVVTLYGGIFPDILVDWAVAP